MRELKLRREKGGGIRSHRLRLVEGSIFALTFFTMELFSPRTPMKFLVILILLMSSVSAFAWEPAEHTMLTEWGEAVTPDNVWQEYPRPQMVRDEWTNLNGLWKFKVTSNRERDPGRMEEEILVPFALETPLSGVGRRLESDEVIWYEREFSLEAAPEGRLLLHFEGVDYKCMVWVNGHHVGDHVGGNLPFFFDISDGVQSGSNTVRLRVVDGTDDPDLYQLRGKQKRDNRGIWYTPSSGIWATVWLEAVPATYLEAVKVTAEMDGGLAARASIAGSPMEAHLRVAVKQGGEVLREQTGFGNSVFMHVKDIEPWSPDSPVLYDLEIQLLDSEGKVLDAVESYVGFRTVGRVQDANGHWQFALNGEPQFYLGPLDQGWWPGSFLNPPSDEAIVWEMEYLKAAGFNMIRKHKKVDPRRYYYHADQIGLVIWQDQPSGGAGMSEWPVWKKLRAEREDYKPHNQNWWSSPEQPLDHDWPDWAHEQYMAEFKAMIDTLYNHPSIVVWTPFNERWGQHRSMEIGTWVKTYDPTRHLNIASGGNFFPVGDIADEHDYPDPLFPLEFPLYDDYIKVIGEFGGHGWAVKGHLWDPDFRNWGYGGMPETLEEYVDRYRRTANLLGEYKRKGVSAGVYTQTTDVEGELNGLVTYDRKVMKMSPELVRRIHEEAGLLD